MADAIGMTHRVDAEGVLRIVFDRPGDKVNLLDEQLLRELDRLLEEARRREDIQAILFQSAKPGMFVAGMDVDQIAAVTDAYRGAEGARFGQSVFQKIADLRGVNPTAPVHTLAPLGIARAHEAVGDIAEAQHSYDLFLELVRDADEGLPVVEAARKEYAAMLEEYGQEAGESG